MEKGARFVTGCTPNPIDRPIFIVGCHRTGTTLLQKSLSRHPDLDILPETKLLAWLYSPRGRALERPGGEVIEFVAERIGRINREWGTPAQAWRLDRLRESVASAPARFDDATGVMRHVLAHAAREDAQRVGEKTPLHVFHIDALRREFPDARFIVTRRDLRGAFHSQATRNEKGALSYRPFASARFVASWLMAERLGEEALRKHGPEVVTHVRYEELASDPAGVFDRLTAFLGIKNTAELLEARVENSSFGAQTSGFTTASIGRWREELPEQTVRELEQLAGPALERAGYACGMLGSAPVRVRAERAKLRLSTELATRLPRLVCYGFRDPRYRQHGVFPRITSDVRPPTAQPRVIVLGNHKSGTTAIAQLLGEMCGLTTTIDLSRHRRREGYRLARGEMSFRAFYARNRDLFESELVKIPAMTFAGEAAAAFFDQSRVVFVIRDPRENIRSILNRRGLAGDRSRLPVAYRLKQRLKGSPSMDAGAWGASRAGYVGVLAQRWRVMAEILERLGDRAVVVRYEDFKADKLGCLERLAGELGLSATADISDRLNHQFQPAGDRSRTLASFFGERNLREIERICSAHMERYGYEPTRGEESA